MTFLVGSRTHHSFPWSPRTASAQRRHKQRRGKGSPWPEMTACRFGTYALSASQNGWSFPLLASLTVACVEPEPSSSSTASRQRVESGPPEIHWLAHARSSPGSRVWFKPGCSAWIACLSMHTGSMSARDWDGWNMRTEECERMRGRRGWRSRAPTLRPSPPPRTGSTPRQTRQPSPGRRWSWRPC